MLRCHAATDFGARRGSVSARRSIHAVRTAGSPASSALETAVFAGAAADVHHSVVGGQVVVADGHHVRLDVAGELHATITELMDGA